MQDAAAAAAIGFRGGVQDQRPHGERIAAFRRAGDERSRLTVAACVLGADPAVPVRAGHELERAIALIAAVEVEAHRHQLGEDVGRRLHEGAALLVRPAAQRGMLDAGGDRNAQVLVDGHQPVALGRLLEIGALHGCVMLGNELRDGGMGAQALRKGAAPVLGKQAAGAGRIAAERCQLLDQRLAFFRWQDLRDAGEAVGIEPFTEHLVLGWWSQRCL